MVEYPRQISHCAYYVTSNYSLLLLLLLLLSTQGTMMGFLTAAGSLARALGPLVITLLYHAKGPTITFATVVGMVGTSIVVLLIFCYRLVPYRPAPGYRTIN